LRIVFDLGKKREKIKELEREIQNPDFWENKKEAIKITQELTILKQEIEEFKKLKKDLNDLEELKRELEEDLIKKELDDFQKKITKAEIKTFLSRKYDKGPAVLTIYAGAGGQDAQDWATMLLRMYERYCQRRGYQVKILHQSFGEAGGPEGRIGIKQVSLEIKGNYVFGFLKKETGVHRLVRLSPFSAKSLRHTSFALVEVLPDISVKDELEYNIKSEEVKIETFRASGPGGQNVNKRETAVRVTHLPTGIKVACQVERLQGLNKEKAMKILRAKLYQLREIAQKKEIKEIKGDLIAQARRQPSEVREKSSSSLIAAEWGNQIRSYVLHPYKMVKDLRTEIESSAVEKILDGELDEFIEAGIKI